MKTEILNVYLSELKSSQGADFVVDEASVISSNQVLQSAFSKVIIKILSILGGIIGSLCLVGFLALAQLLESDIASIVLGVIFVGGSLILGRVIRNLVLDTAIICFYLLGIGLLCVGLYGATDSENVLIFAIFISGLAAILLSERFVPVFLGTLFLTGSFISFFYVNNLSGLVQLPVILIETAILWLMLNEPAITASGKKANLLFRPVQAGLFISFLAGIILVYQFPVYTLAPVAPWFLSAAIWLAIFFLIYMILQEMQACTIRNMLIVYALAIAAAVPLFFAPHVSGALLMILICFHYGYRTEFIISTGFLIYALSRYYYDMHLTLLAKSGILCLSGLVFIALWLFVRFQKDIDEEN